MSEAIVAISNDLLGLSSVALEYIIALNQWRTAAPIHQGLAQHRLNAAEMDLREALGLPRSYLPGGPEIPK